jgi:plasmid segregation protein ParM
VSKFSDNIQNGGDLPLGLDDGYDETKVALPNGECIRIPSLAKSGGSDMISIDEGESKVFIYQTPDGVFTTGQVLESDSTSFDEYPVSAMNRVIVSHALRVSGLSASHKLSICTGLPLKRIYRGSTLNKPLIASKTANLMKNDVVARDNYKLPIVSKHRVLAEGLAAWFDHVIHRGSDGQLTKNIDNYQKRTALIDIGGRTTDIAVVKAGILEYQRSSTLEVGMLSVKELIRESVYEEFDGVELTNEQLFTAIHENRIKLWGKWENISSIVNTSQEEISKRIYAESMRKLKKAADIDDVIFVGGTVNKFEKLLEGWFRNQSIAPDPEFANARGMQKFTELMLSQGK